MASALRLNAESCSTSCLHATWRVASSGGVVPLSHGVVLVWVTLHGRWLLLADVSPLGASHVHLVLLHLLLLLTWVWLLPLMLLRNLLLISTLGIASLLTLPRVRWRLLCLVAISTALWIVRARSAAAVLWSLLSISLVLLVWLHDWILLFNISVFFLGLLLISALFILGLMIW